MATEKKSGAEEPMVPSPDTFDFSEYVAGRSTFPKFPHTVYLDQDSGNALLGMYDECEKTAEEGKRVEEQLKFARGSVSRSFVDDDVENLEEQLASIRARAEGLEEEKKRLEDKVRSTSMTLTFQVGNAEKLGSVSRAAEKEFVKKNGPGSDNDLEYMARRHKYVLSYQMAEYCVRVTSPDGREGSLPGVKDFIHLMDSLTPSESLRLAQAINSALDSSSTWADRLDAGFPGGGTDVEGSQMGSACSEVSEVVGDPSAGLADRRVD